MTDMHEYDVPDEEFDMTEEEFDRRFAEAMPVEIVATREEADFFPEDPS